MNNRRVIWEPLKGSQELLMACPANIILAQGGRGYGKTDCQIMRFRSQVGKGYGRFWKGLIVDTQLSTLDDIVNKTKK